MLRKKVNPKSKKQLLIVAAIIISPIVFVNLPIIPLYDTFNCIKAPCDTPMTSIYGKYLNITSFEECVAAGNPVMESYPRQCRANGQLFVEEIIQIPDCNLGPC